MKNIDFTILLMTFVMSIFNTEIFAQGTYANLNVGYAVGMSTQSLQSNSIRNGNSTTHQLVNVSLGQGVNIGGAIGYMFNENIGAELGLSYLFGDKSSSRDASNNHTTDYTLSSRMLRIVPTVVIESGLEKLNPYAKFGLIIGYGSITDEYNDYNNGDITYQMIKSKSGAALGISSALGFMLGLNENMLLFVELNSVNLSYSPERGEVMVASYNGVDLLPSMTTKEKNIDYLDSYTSISGDPSPDSQPEQSLKQKFPYGSIGLNIGLKITLK